MLEPSSTIKERIAEPMSTPIAGDLQKAADPLGSGKITPKLKASMTLIMIRSEGKNIANQSAQKQLFQEHHEAASYHSKIIHRGDSIKDNNFKAPHSEEVQSYPSEMKRAEPAMAVGTDLPIVAPPHHSPMEEDRDREDQIMFDEPNFGYMIDSLCEDVVEEKGDNEELLDDKDLIGEDLKYLEMESKKFQTTLSTSHEDSLNETIWPLRQR